MTSRGRDENVALIIVFSPKSLLYCQGKMQTTLSRDEEKSLHVFLSLRRITPLKLARVQSPY